MKKVFFIAAVVAASIFGVMKANDVNSNSKMSDLQMENIEAIGQCEIIVGPICYAVCNADCFLGTSKYDPDFMVVIGRH